MLITRKPNVRGTNDLCDPELSQLPIEDLAIINFMSESDLRKYYTANIESVPYCLIELMLDTRSLCRNKSKHRIRSYQDVIQLEYEYLPEIVFPDDKDFIPIIVGADILNITIEQITELAQNEQEAYVDENDNTCINSEWVVVKLAETIGLGNAEPEITLGNNGQGRIKITIKRELK